MNFAGYLTTSWRFEIESNLTGIIENLKTLSGAPETLTQESEKNLSKMLQATKNVSVWGLPRISPYLLTREF
jgi:hypothetical protein